MPGMQDLYNLFRINPNAFPGTNPGAFSGAAAQDQADLPTSFENKREMVNTLSHDQAVNDRFEGNQDAQAMDFANPRAQAEDKFNKALKTILIPEQIKLQAASEGADEARTYSSLEHEKDRQARADIAAEGAQTRAQAEQGQNQRANAALSVRDQQFNQLHPPSVLDRMFGRTAPTAPAVTSPSGMVPMQHPDGSPLMVPADKVEWAKSQGARLAE